MKVEPFNVEQLAEFKEAFEHHFKYNGYEKTCRLVEDYEDIFGIKLITMHDFEEKEEG